MVEGDSCTLSIGGDFVLVFGYGRLRELGSTVGYEGVSIGRELQCMEEVWENWFA